MSTPALGRHDSHTEGSLHSTNDDTSAPAPPHAYSVQPEGIMLDDVGGKGSKRNTAEESSPSNMDDIFSTENRAGREVPGLVTCVTPASGQQLQPQQPPQQEPQTAALPVSSPGQTPGQNRRQSCWLVMIRAIMALPTATRIRVLLLTFLAFAQVVTGITILILSAHAHEKSDRPLRLFIILYIVRLLLYYPLYIHHKAWPEEAALSERALLSWLKMLRNLLVVSAGVLFICGTIWVFTSDKARSTAPLLYYTSLVYVVLGFVYLATPIIFVFGMLAFFLLCYTLSSTFRMQYHKNKGAGFGQLSQIPLVRYTGSSRVPVHAASLSSPPSLHGHQHPLRRTEFSVNGTHEQRCSSDDIAINVTGTDISPNDADVQSVGTSRLDASQSTTSLHSDTRIRQYGFIRTQIFNPFARIAHRLTRSRRQRAAEAEMYKKQLAGSVPDFAPRDPEDNVCAICLCEYDDGDILRLLPCNHHLHQGCVDEWLHINQSCPLCKRVVTSDSDHRDEADEPTVDSNSNSVTVQNRSSAVAT
ncbi:hypothetical protein H4S08_001859 [Coemansia sp. RSA 1365]|nr:hypothetical protein H4S08_001859 [Coemansia sp. RSA 1365]